MAATSGAIRAGRAFVEMFVDKRGIERGLRQVQQRFARLGRTLTLAGGALVGVGTAFAAPFALSIKAASDLEETMSKFNVVFGSQASAVRAWGDEFASQVGRSKAQVMSFLAQAQDTFVPLGFDPAEAEEMSKQVAQLAIDLASFNNISDQEAFDRLISSMVGNTENLRAFGVVAQQAQINAQALSMGFDPRHLTPYQKALAIMEITLAGTTAAQGDAIRTADSFANQMKRLRGLIDDASASIGQALLPVLTPMVEKVGLVVQRIAEWIQVNPQAVVAAAQMTAGILAGGAALVGLGVAASSTAAIIGLLATSIGMLTGAIAFLLSPLGLAVGGIAASVAWATASADAMSRLSEAWKAFGERASAAWNGITAAVQSGDLKLAAEIAFAAVELEWNKLLDRMRQAWDDFLAPKTSIGLAWNGEEFARFEFGEDAPRRPPSDATVRAEERLERLLQQAAAAAAPPPTGGLDGTAITASDMAMLDTAIKSLDATAGAVVGIEQITVDEAPLKAMEGLTKGLHQSAMAAIVNTEGTFSSEASRIFFNRGEQDIGKLQLKQLEEQTRILNKIEDKGVYT